MPFTGTLANQISMRKRQPLFPTTFDHITYCRHGAPGLFDGTTTHITKTPLKNFNFQIIYNKISSLSSICAYEQ